MEKLILASLALCSLINCLSAELIYAAVSELPANFLPPPHTGNMLQSANQIRAQRSLYGPPFGGWQGPPVPSHSIGLGHISKQELVTLLEAAKEAAKSEAEPQPEPAPASAAAGAPPGVPLTVSLPAFVPIQLSAMYTGGAGGGAGAVAAAPSPGEESGGGEAEEEEGDDEEEEEEEEEEDEDEPEPVPAPIKPYPPIYHPWSSRFPLSGRVVPYAVRSNPPKSAASAKTKSKSRSKSSKSKAKSRSKKRTNRKPSSNKASKSNLPNASSGQNIQLLPPPPFLARAPGPLQLVPSDQLLSNWK